MRTMPSLVLACALLAGFVPAIASATPEGAAATPAGRPRIVLDHLAFPHSVPNAAHFEKRLREVLSREAHRAIWGAGRENTITYRFLVTQLTVEQRGDVVHVRCQATGQLPKGKSAKGTLTFSGPARERNAVVIQVLEIVARGVITRLAELERARRGQPG
ncbi:MAG: hypothetical protein JW751_09955 [Polyangiaceae bacterium]|nr:hypothetical protein [Polyangiaceae bacterium]